ncbi:hypothetical protein BS78_02G313400 [Paspalum vaginatum]|nr:hypothetical protein BS78_02G313400 [Paspalum vaginatum]
MHSWPVSDMPKLRAPGYIRMPGRPKTERKREPHEKPKTTKMCRLGTVIRCRKCKGVGHNIASCDKRNASAASKTASATNQNGQGSQHGSPSAAASQVALVPQTDTMAGNNSRKRQHSETSTPASQTSIATTSTKHQAKKAATNLKKTKATGRVATSTGGSATMTLHAQSTGAAATSSVTVNIKSGRASGKAVVDEGAKKSTKQPASNTPMLLLPPWDSARL